MMNDCHNRNEAKSSNKNGAPIVAGLQVVSAAIAIERDV